jgi:soluble lytic murein transglycosylase-like protein
MRFLPGILVAVAAWAGEYAVLANGFRLPAERHEVVDGKVRLYSSGGGSTELDASLVAGFEREAEAPRAPVPVAATAPPRPDVRELADRAAIANGLPKALVHSVVAAESAYQPAAVSPKGAIGLMQLMPATARAYQADPHDPAQNLEAGARHLRDLLLKYDGDPYKALAAYNAGPGAVARYNGVPPYAETQTYVQRVLSRYQKAQR